jgi:copper homeostasis protein
MPIFKDKVRTMEYMLEVIAYNIDCCIAIERAGAARIELCSNPMEGGTTPSAGLVRQARILVTTELYPMIRPRGGNFTYSALEFEVMKADVIYCREVGCDGIVTGILTPEGRVDVERMKILTELASPLGITFNRAFDRCRDAFEALEDIIECGCERLLTSGQSDTALEGADVIKKLIEKAGERITIMPGAGIRSNNLAQLISLTGASEYHTSALLPGREGDSSLINEAELMQMSELIRQFNG